MDHLVYAKVEGSGKPMVIIHGFLGMSDNWKTLGNRYAEIGYEVHLLDMRNHGRSFHSNEFNYTVMVNDVVAYCKAHSLENIVVIGHSMGGKIAMQLATTYPSLVATLIVADMSPREYAPHHQDVMQALNAVNFSTNPSREEVQKTIENYINDQGIVQFLMKNVYRVTPQQLGFRFNLNAFNADDKAIGQALNKEAVFNGKTLFLRGENSNYIEESDEALVLKHFPNAKITTIKNAGHWLHADNPNAFFAETAAFLN